MGRKRCDPTSPEFVEAMLRRVESMTREELLERLAWRPEGAEEPWRLARSGAGAEGAPADTPLSQPEQTSASE